MIQQGHKKNPPILAVLAIIAFMYNSVLFWGGFKFKIVSLFKTAGQASMLVHLIWHKGSEKM